MQRSDTASASPAVEVRGMSKSFGRTQAMRRVSASFFAGEVHCLLGENGAGKSTLGKIVGGLYAADEGELLVDGRPCHFHGVADARKLGIALVFQELSLAPHLSVEDNLCLGTEGVLQPFALLPRRRERERCRKLLADLGIAVPLGLRVGELPTAQQQLLEIAKALYLAPRVLILDEPTAMLGAGEKEVFLALLRRLRAAGTAVVFITHHIEEVLEAADRVTIMKDGEVAHAFPMSPEVDEDYVVERLAGRRLARAAAGRRGEEGREVARLRGLPTAGGGDGEILLRAGEIIGLYGVVGCGREEMARTLVGLAAVGEATLLGSPFRPRSPAAAAKAGVSYLPAGRAANCVLPTRSIRENLMLSQAHAHRRGGMLNGRLEAQRTREQLQRFRVKFGAADDPITSLSGGNQQKVLLARALGRPQHLLVLEDPTAGIDIAAKQEIHDLLRRKAAEGLSVLLLSGDLPETLGLCHHVYTVFKGRVVRCYHAPTPEDQPDILADVLGRRVGAPAAAGLVA